MPDPALGHRDAAATQAAAADSPLAERRTVLAADGKALRAAHQPDGFQTKLFCLYDHAHCMVLTQASVTDGDKIAAFTTALAALPDLSEVVITADALHCQREHATWLHAHGGHYLFTVKANQPTLRRAVAALPWGQVPGSRRRQVGHGRTESRSIKVIDLDGHSLQELFPHVNRAIKVVRRRRCHRTGKQSVETVYAVTSLDYRHADAGLLAIWIQGHWGSENRVHHVRDVTQSEDRSHIRAGAGPHVVATLRNTAPQPPPARRAHQHRPRSAPDRLASRCRPRDHQRGMITRLRPGQPSIPDLPPPCSTRCQIRQHRSRARMQPSMGCRPSVKWSRRTATVTPRRPQRLDRRPQLVTKSKDH